VRNNAFKWKQCPTGTAARFCNRRKRGPPASFLSGVTTYDNFPRARSFKELCLKYNPTDADRIDGMMDEAYRAYDSHVRRLAKRHGLKLRKTRNRKRVADFGGYMLVDESNDALAGSQPVAFSLTLAAAENYLLDRAWLGRCLDRMFGGGAGWGRRLPQT
jgi:hypothetical protein